MPRNAQGQYTLPAGNPVVTGTLIESTWANPTMADLGAEIQNSLDRNGRGGMLAQFKSVDGGVAAPGMTFAQETTTGISRPAAGALAFSVLGQEKFRAVAGGLQFFTGAGIAGLTSLLIGLATPLTAQGAVIPPLQVAGTTANTSSTLVARFDATANAPRVLAAKSRGATVGTHGLLVNDDVIAEFTGLASDGAKFLEAGRMQFRVGGTPGVDDMPTVWRLQLTQDGASAPSDVVQIDNLGRVVFGGVTGAFGSTVRAMVPMSGATAIVFRSDGQIQSSVTSLYANYSSAPSTAAAAFTLPRLEHFRADQVSIGAGSAVTQEIGVFVAQLSAGSGRQAFYGDVGSGTGRYNLYMPGTAQNYVAGFMGFGVSLPGAPIDVLAENASAIGVNIRGRSADNVSVLRWQDNASSTQYGSIVGRSTSIEYTSGSSGAVRFRLLAAGTLQMATKIQHSRAVATMSAAISLDCAQADEFELNAVLNTNTTLTFSNLDEGQRVEVIIQQDGTGTRTVGVAGTTKSGGSVGLLANQISVLSVRNINGTLLLAWSAFAP